MDELQDDDDGEEQEEEANEEEEKNNGDDIEVIARLLGSALERLPHIQSLEDLLEDSNCLVILKEFCKEVFFKILFFVIEKTAPAIWQFEDVVSEYENLIATDFYQSLQATKEKFEKKFGDEPEAVEKNWQERCQILKSFILNNEEDLEEILFPC